MTCCRCFCDFHVFCCVLLDKFGASCLSISSVSVWFYFAKFRLVLLEVQDLKKQYCRKLITDFLWSFKFFLHGSFTNSIKIFMVPPHLKGQLGPNTTTSSPALSACRMPNTRSNPYILWLQPSWRRRKNPRWSVLVWGISWVVGENLWGSGQKRFPSSQMPHPRFVFFVEVCCFFRWSMLFFFVEGYLQDWAHLCSICFTEPWICFTANPTKSLELEVTFMGHVFFQPWNCRIWHFL